MNTLNIRIFLICLMMSLMILSGGCGAGSDNDFDYQAPSAEDTGKAPSAAEEDTGPTSPAPAADRPKPTELSGSIENTYAATGPYRSAMQAVTGFQIFYPRDLEGAHPIITWGNGTGAPTIGYYPLLNHLASWGFVVIASNSSMNQNGQAMVSGIDYLIEENENPESIFYGMLDTDKIGTTGHSQGGGGAINAAKDSRVTCSVPIAPSPGQIGQVEAPMFLIAGAQDPILAPSLVRMTSYAMARCPIVFGIVANTNHMTFVGAASTIRGYVTAWFMYQLQDDPTAQAAFEGSCEICGNPNWTVEKKNF